MSNDELETEIEDNETDEIEEGEDEEELEETDDSDSSEENEKKISAKVLQQLREDINCSLNKKGYGGFDTTETWARLKHPAKAKKCDYKASRTCAIHLQCFRCQETRKDVSTCVDYDCPLWLFRPNPDTTNRPDGYVPTIEQYDMLLGLRKPKLTNSKKSDHLKEWREKNKISNKDTVVGRTAPKTPQFIQHKTSVITDDEVFSFENNEITFSNLGRRGRPLKISIEEAKSLLENKELLLKLLES
jgi:hypothetical protein